MASYGQSVDVQPTWSWIAPLAACTLILGKTLGVVPYDATAVIVLAAVLLGASVFASVHHAETIALRVGEPFGSIVLAVAVTIIEVALIMSLMIAFEGEGSTLARDTVFATILIVLNGIIGLSLVFGGWRHREQGFRTDASAAALSVLATLSVITLVLPNYTLATPGPTYAASQLIFVSVVSITLYAVFLFVQTIRHRDYFLNEPDAVAHRDDVDDHGPVPSARTALISLGLLGLALIGVVLLAKMLSPPLESALETAGLPKAFLGVVIAAIVLLPESMAAVRAALNNRMQTSLNLALGSAMATIGLTIPAVSTFSLWLGTPLTLGLPAEETALLLLTLFISTVTLATGRTTILQGTVHLVIFGVFVFLSAVP